MTENKSVQTNHPPETPPTNPEKKPKPWLMGTFLFLLAALSTAIAFLVYQNNQLKQKTTLKENLATPSPIPTLTPAPLPTEPPSPTPTSDPTANWLTYSDENMCYTFKYPKKITLNERKEENIIHLSLWGPTQKKETEFYDGISLSFSFPLNIGSTPFKEYVDSKIEESKQHGEILKPREAITINGISGYTYTSQGLGTFQNIFLQSANKACTVEITNATSDPTNQGYQQTVAEILSTFQFTN